MVENSKDKDGNDIEIVIDENGKSVARAIDYKQRYEELIRLWYEASKAYNQESDKAKAARKVLGIFGITTGKKQKKIPKGTFFTEYQTRVAELSEKKRVTIADKQKIINDIAKKHDGMDPNTMHAYLRETKAFYQKCWKDLYRSKGYKIGEDTFKKLDYWDKHFLPPHK